MADQGTNGRKGTDHQPKAVALARTSSTNVHKSRYSPEEIEIALSVLAFHCGNARKASDTLEAEGRRVPESTLKLWRTDLYAERYRQIEADEVPKRYARAAERNEGIAERLAGLEEQLADQVAQQASELAPRDAAGALRNVSVAKAINVDKALVIRGRPTHISATADVTELLKSLRSRFDDVIVSSAVEEAEPPEAA